jgi:HEAT repeat protein
LALVWAIFSLLLLSSSRVDGHLQDGQNGSGIHEEALIEEYIQQVGSEQYDFAALEEFSLRIVSKGVRSADSKQQLASIYGAQLAGVHIPIDVIAAGIRSEHLATQLACIQMIARFQDDRCDDLLLKAMSSQFLAARLEAAFALSIRKHPAAVGQIEALLTQIPPSMHFIFPEFFAMIGTKESIGSLCLLMDDPDINCRTEALLSAGRHRRDDLLPKILKRATHHHPAIQEATAYSLALLQHSASLKHLKKLLSNSSTHVQVAAARGLIHFRDPDGADWISALVIAKNLYAIQVAGEEGICSDALAKLTQDGDIQVRINAAIALLNIGDRRAWPAIGEILLHDNRDLGIVALPSPGRSLSMWKVLTSLTQQQQQVGDHSDLFAINLEIREDLLRRSINLGEACFLEIAEKIFAYQQTELIPLLCFLLETVDSKGAVALLEEKAHLPGFPLVRVYAALSLYRMGIVGGHEEQLKNWLRLHQKVEFLQFRHPLPLYKRPLISRYDLSPEETSRLLIEIYQAIADRHTKEGIDLILRAMRHNSATTRPALAGLLLRALQ